MQSLTSVTALGLSETLPTAATLSLLEIQQEITFEKTLTAPIIRQIDQTMGRPMLIKLVCAVLKLFVDSLNITQSLSPLQVYEIATLWIEKYPTDSLKDLILCLKRVKQGYYGKIYNRIDIEVISEFWTQYLNEKAEYRENKHRIQKAEEASDELGMLRQIQAHAPETANMIKTMLRPTPIVEAPMQTSHESYLDALRKKLPSAYESELEALRKEALSSGKNFTDVVELIDSEITRRNQEQTVYQPENEPN